MPPKKKRKTRVTQKDVKAARKEIKMSSYQRKRRIIPGPWTEMEVDFTIEPRFRQNNLFAFDKPVLGTYTYTHNWDEKGWYPIIFNLEADNLKELVAEHGVNNVMIATEKAFNEMSGPGNRPKYGNIIILGWSCDHSQNEDPSKRFISISAKTNYKSIPGFVATRKGERIIIEDD